MGNHLKISMRSLGFLSVSAFLICQAGHTGQKVYPAPLSNSPIQARDPAVKNFQIQINPACFGTNLRRVSDPVSPDSDIQMTIQGWPNLPDLMVTFPATATQPMKIGQTTCPATSATAMDSAKSKKSDSLSTTFTVSCAAGHNFEQHAHACAYDSAGNLHCAGWGCKPVMNELVPNPTCVPTAHLVPHSCKDLGNHKVLCSHVSTYPSRPNEAKLTALDGSPFTGANVIARNTGKQIILSFPDMTKPMARTKKGAPYGLSSAALAASPIKFKQQNGTAATVAQSVTLDSTNPSPVINLSAVKMSVLEGTRLAPGQVLYIPDHSVNPSRLVSATISSVNSPASDPTTAAVTLKPTSFRDPSGLKVASINAVANDGVYRSAHYMGHDGTLKNHGQMSLSANGFLLSVAPEFPGQEGFCGGYHSPLMLFFGKARIPRFDAISSFPLDKYGDDIFWPEKGSSGYFLALDEDGSHQITNAGQLFGRGDGSDNGFEALAKLDANGDGVIDEKDPAFKKLVLWRDKNADGKSQPDEVLTLKEMGIVSLSLKYSDSSPTPIANRALISGRGEFYYNGKKTGELMSGRLYDIWFKPVSQSGPGWGK